MPLEDQGPNQPDAAQTEGKKGLKERIAAAVKEAPANIKGLVTRMRGESARPALESVVQEARRESEASAETGVLNKLLNTLRSRPDAARDEETGDIALGFNVQRGKTFADDLTSPALSMSTDEGEDGWSELSLRFEGPELRGDKSPQDLEIKAQVQLNEQGEIISLRELGARKRVDANAGERGDQMEVQSVQDPQQITEMIGAISRELPPQWARDENLSTDPTRESAVRIFDRGNGRLEMTRLGRDDEGNKTESGARVLLQVPDGESMRHVVDALHDLSAVAGGNVDAVFALFTPTEQLPEIDTATQRPLSFDARDRGLRSMSQPEPGYENESETGVMREYTVPRDAYPLVQFKTGENQNDQLQLMNAKDGTKGENIAVSPELKNTIQAEIPSTAEDKKWGDVVLLRAVGALASWGVEPGRIQQFLTEAQNQRGLTLLEEAPPVPEQLISPIDAIGRYYEHVMPDPEDVVYDALSDMVAEHDALQQWMAADTLNSSEPSEEGARHVEELERQYKEIVGTIESKRKSVIGYGGEMRHIRQMRKRAEDAYKGRPMHVGVGSADDRAMQQFAIQLDKINAKDSQAAA